MDGHHDCVVEHVELTAPLYIHVPFIKHSEVKKSCVPAQIHTYEVRKYVLALLFAPHIYKTIISKVYACTHAQLCTFANTVKHH